jgi:hypothetical protein
MKTTERHQLKHNEVSDVLHHAMGQVEQHRRTMLGAIAAVLVIGVGMLAYSLISARRANESGGALAEALVVLEAPVTPPAPAPAPGQAPMPNIPTPGSYASEDAKLQAALPKLMAVAEKYPGSPAGVHARYEAATVLAGQGKTAEARQRYQEVADADGRGIYGRMAKLAVAGLDADAKQYDQAINALRELSLDVKGDLPVDAILVQLGTVCRAAGKKADARQAFQRVTTEFASSPYAADARKQLDALKAGA